MFGYIKNKVAAGTRRIKRQPFRFLDLPPEIRNKIYDLVLCYPGEDSIIRPCDPLPRRRWGKKYKRWLYRNSLFFINRQFQYESIAVYYSCRDFEFSDLQQVHFFLSTIGPQCRAWITSLRIKLSKPEYASTAFPFILKLPRLRKLSLRFDHKTFCRCLNEDANRDDLIDFYVTPYIPLVSNLVKLREIEKLVIERSFFSGTDNLSSRFMRFALTEEEIHKLLAPTMALPASFVDTPPWWKTLEVDPEEFKVFASVLES